jgi:hypothetical protein
MLDARWHTVANEMIRGLLLSLSSAFLVVGVASGAEATRFYVAFPCCGTAPGGCRIVAAGAGAALCFAAVPMDAKGEFDLAWTGTIAFSSSDPLATLPSPCSLPYSAGSCSGLYVTFRTPGHQTLTVVDVGGGLEPGTAVMNVFGVANAIPLVSWPGRVALTGLLALAGMLLMRRAV